jgi:hypothetical protein
MNKIRVLVQVIVMVGILTGCDSCDDGMDYPIVEYAQGVNPNTTQQQQIERIRLGYKTSHPDIKVIEIRAGVHTAGQWGKIGDRIIFPLNLVANLQSANATQLQAVVDEFYQSYPYTPTSQLFGAPAGLLAMADNPAATADDPAATADSTAATADDPAA